VPGVRYAFISSYLKGQEARLMTSAHVDSLQTAPSIQDALAVVRETDVGRYLEELPVRSFEYLDESLWRYLGHRYAYIEWLKLVPRDVLKVLRAYRLKYDVFNVKAALEGVSAARKARMIPLGTIHNHGMLDELSNASDVDDIIGVLAECGLRDYMPILERYKTDETPKARFIVQIRLDSEYYRHLFHEVGYSKDGRVLLQAFGLIADLANLQIASRAIIEGIGPEAAGLTITGGYEISGELVNELLSLDVSDLPARLATTRYSGVASELAARYETTGSITAVDEVIDRYKFRMLRELLALRLLSPLVIAWYIVLKETEVRNLRLILKAIADGVPVQEIREYLVL
jgi:V/A-type H+/Na+-transporting ATPase subunit C